MAKTEKSTDRVLEQLKLQIGDTTDFLIKHKKVRAKVLDARISESAFAFDFEKGKISTCYQFRVEQVDTGKRFWTPAFTAKLK